MKFRIKLTYIIIFISITWVLPVLFACPRTGNIPSFDVHYLTVKEVQQLKIKAQLTYKIKNEDTIKDTELRFAKNGEAVYWSFFKYGRYFTEQFFTYDSIEKTYVSNIFEEKLWTKRERVKELDHNWIFKDFYYPNHLSQNESIYLQETEIYDSISNTKTMLKKVYSPNDPDLIDTLEFISYKEKYNSNGLIESEESNFGENTLKILYTYDQNLNQTAISYSYGAYTIYTYKNSQLLKETEYNSDSSLSQYTLFNKLEKPIHKYGYNDTTAIDSEQIITYDSNGLITQVLNFGYLDDRTYFKIDSNYYDIIGTDTMYSLIDYDSIHLNYNLPPETLLFTYEYYE